MKQTPVLFISALAIFTLVLYITMPPSFLPHTPKFKKGVCFAELIKEKEFIPERAGIIFKVLEVGNTDYKIIEESFYYLEEYGVYDSWDIRTTDRNYILVNCQAPHK